ncbi:MAG: hypothetical protein KatS3mg077_0386 [Candidatus Binatia bacterium]|nr:MAG: hypothetical protein KatS3mg077_0386 [Candidatus Binatia bacterium]
MRVHTGVAGWLLSALAALSFFACGDDGEEQLSVGAGADTVIVFAPEGNRLRAYAPLRGAQQVVIPSHADDPAKGRDINGQVCFLPDGSGRFIAGEDTNQPNPPPGWGLFQVSGRRVGELSASQITRYVPTYQPSADNPENYGCGFLRDGRLLTTDIGNEADGPPSGQLIVWFPPLDAPNPRYCKIDIAIGTAGGIFVDADDRIYVASAREQPGIYLYEGPFPTSDEAAGGCGNRDSTGAPLATTMRKRLFIPADVHIRTPNAVWRTPRGTFLVTSIFNGVIAEYDAQGRFIRRILQPVSGERLPFPSTGTPLGIAVDSSGTVYYADLGLVQDGLNIGPGRGRGTVRRIRFDANGAPLAPEVLDQGLNFPDGIGVWEPSSSAR